jgi:hypothetical protein
MRAQLTLVLLAAAALVLAAAPGQAQTYEDYASGRAYVTTAPAAPTTAAETRAPTYRDYATGRAATMIASEREPARRGTGGEFPVYIAPVPSYMWARLGMIPDWPQPAPSITSTVARSSFLPSAGMQLSTAPLQPGTSITETIARSRFTPSAQPTQWIGTPNGYSRTPGLMYYNGR